MVCNCVFKPKSFIFVLKPGIEAKQKYDSDTMIYAAVITLIAFQKR